MSETNEIGIRFSANIDGLKETMQQATDVVRIQTQEMKGHFDSLISGISAFKGAFVALAAITGGGAFLKGAVNASKEFNGEVQKMAKLLGTTATDASYFVEAMKMSGGNTEQAEKAVAALTRTLRTTPDKFDQLGVATRQANGEFRPMQDILLDVNDKFKHMEDGTGKNVAMAAIFGRQWTEVGAALKLTKGSLEEAKNEAEALGLVVTKQSQQDVAEYKISMAGVKSVLESLTKVIGDAFMPILTELGSWFKEIGPAAFTVMKGAVGGITAVFWYMREGVIVVWETINAFVNSVAIPLEALGSALYKLVHGDFKGAADEMLSVPAKVGAAWGSAMDSMEAGAVKTNEKVKNLFVRGDDVKKKEGKPAPDLSVTKTKEDPDKRMAEWKAFLQDKKEAEKDYFKDSTASDLEYWQGRLALVTGNTEKDKTVRRALNTEIFNLNKTQATQERALSDEELANAKKLGDEVMARMRQDADAQVALGKMTEDEKFRIYLNTEQGTYALDVARLDGLSKTYEKDKVAFQKYQDELLQIKAKHDNDMAKLQDQQAQAEDKRLKAMFAPFASAISTSINGIITGTSSMQKSLGNIFQSIMLSYIDSLVKPMLDQWIIGNVKKLASSNATVAALFGLDKSAGVSQAATAKATAAAVIPADAAMAASGAAAAVAPTPFVGPALAAGAFAETYAMVMSSMAGALAGPGFAVGSWSVPGDMFTKIHKGEMIVPAQFADNVRDGGGLGGKAGGDMNVTIHAMDGASVQRVLMDNGHHIAQALRRQQRNFSPM